LVAVPGFPNARLGRLTKTTAGGVVQTYRYDLLGRPWASQETVDSAAYSFCYTHQPAGVSNITYPSGRQVATTYDRASRPAHVAGQKAGQTTDYVNAVTRWPAGGLNLLTMGSGQNSVAESWTYNPRLQPSAISVGNNGSVWKLENFYCLGDSVACTSNNGNVLSQKLTAAGTLNLKWQYGYDGLNRITSAGETSGGAQGWSQGYSYDQPSQLGQFGNLLVTDTNTVSPIGLSCTGYDLATNHCTSFTYDDDGNITAIGSRTMTYDAENRQKTLTDGVQWEYTYDADGRRVKKASASSSTVYVYDAMGQLAAEYGASAGDDPNCTPCYLTRDHLGSTRLVTDATGAVRRYDYLPFGGEINSSWGNRTSVTGYVMSDHLNPKFTGKDRDYESGLGLDYFGARYFSGAQGRFTTSDPLNWLQWQHSDGPSFSTATDLGLARDGKIGNRDDFRERLSNPQTLNLYAYVRNNPLRYVDPFGLEENSPDNLAKRKAIADLAQKSQGSTNWAYTKAPVGWKCSTFVNATAKQAGAEAVFLGRGPVAGEWKNKNAKIENWRVLKAGESPQPGDVSAIPIRNPGPGATGHVGIATKEPNGSVTVTSAHETVVSTENAGHFTLNPLTTWRRYTGN
jgi:RHS repeat-associated protein